MDPIASIIIPAHNESQTIHRLLGALTDGMSAGELDIIVVCNGCTDETASIARSFPAPTFPAQVRVIETDVSSKVHALNLGDRAAWSLPRFYVDADVIFTLQAVRGMVRVMRDEPILAAAPQITLNLDNASPGVRAFYRVDRMMPSHREGIGGSGVYALSKAGRLRFDEFPNITADDAFVRRQFTPTERRTLHGARSIVTPPTSLAGVIKIKSRSHFGNIEMNSLFPHLTGNKGKGNRVALLKLIARPTEWYALSIYLYVKFTARVRAQRQWRNGNRRLWERDDTSRQIHPPIDAPDEVSHPAI